MPLLEALRHCPAARVVPTDMRRYRELDRRFQAALRQVAPRIESFGLGAVFTELGGAAASGEEVAEAMRAAVREACRCRCAWGWRPESSWRGWRRRSWRRRASSGSRRATRIASSRRCLFRAWRAWAARLRPPWRSSARARSRTSWPWAVTACTRRSAPMACASTRASCATTSRCASPIHRAEERSRDPGSVDGVDFATWRSIGRLPHRSDVERPERRGRLPYRRDAQGRGRSLLPPPARWRPLSVRRCPIDEAWRARARGAGCVRPWGSHQLSSVVAAAEGASSSFPWAEVTSSTVPARPIFRAW